MAETMRILLVEDDAEDQTLIRGLLSRLPSTQFRWEVVDRLSMATELLRTQPFDVVLLDLSLPDSQGLETFVQLQPHAVCLPVVVLTGMVNERTAIEAVRAGAQDYLVKGRTEGEPIVRALRYAIERKRFETALRTKIEQLTSLLARDLAAPLTTIQRKMEMLLEDFTGNPEQHNALLSVQREIHQIERLFSQLPESGRRFQYDHPSRVQKKSDGRFSPAGQEPDRQVVEIEPNKDYRFTPEEPPSQGYMIPGALLNELILLMGRAMQPGVQTAGAQRVPGSGESPGSEQAGDPPLSRRELEILPLIANGLTNREIARQMKISLRTVERTCAAIIRKLALHNRGQLLAYAVQQRRSAKDEQH
jgi:DNA-binding NarL/FixJ family response regulator